jgi:hypothetical protein
MDAAEPVSADWQNRYHSLLGRCATPMLYDMLEPWMSAAERDKVRSVIARATRGKWALGMGALPAMGAHLSNWETWVTGEYLVAIMSIEGEEGFDPEAYADAMRALRLTAMLLADPVSGATYEGMAKNLIHAPVLAAASRRLPLQEKFVAFDMPYNHVRRFILHATVPWGGQMMMDDLLGGVSGLRPAPATVLKYAYPDDPMVDYVYHSTMAGAADYGSVYFNTYGLSPEIMSWPFTQAWSGPEDLELHLQQAVAETSEAPGYFSNFRGLMIGRADWSADALQLYAQARCIVGGHPTANRGYLVVNALGRNWVPFYGWYNEESEYHSVVTVDGEGQDFTPATVLDYGGAANRTDALVDWLAADLGNCYRRSGSHPLTLNETRLVPDASRPWMDLPGWRLVHWYLGDQPAASLFTRLTYPDAVRFDRAFRTSALVRGAHPYVLVVDDVRKDDDPHEYRWGLSIPEDIYGAGGVSTNGHEAVFSDADGERHLLVRAIEARGFTGVESVVYLGNKNKDQPIPRLEVVAQGVETRYVVLLAPYRTGDPMPVTAVAGDTITVAWAGQEDVWDIRVDAHGRSLLRGLRDGAVALGLYKRPNGTVFKFR